MYLTYPKDTFTYQYLAGPVETPEEVETIREGNCRMALQVYFYQLHRRFFARDEIYLPGGYKVWGEFIFEEIDFRPDELRPGDVIYAEGIRGKTGQPIDKSRGRYADHDEWLYHLHSVNYIGQSRPGGPHYIWHATHIDGGTAVWTWDKFLHYFKPVSAKRVI